VKPCANHFSVHKDSDFATIDAEDVNTPVAVKLQRKGTRGYGTIFSCVNNLPESTESTIRVKDLNSTIASIGHVKMPVYINFEASWFSEVGMCPSPITPLLDKLSVCVKDLDAVVARVRNVQKRLWMRLRTWAHNDTLGRVVAELSITNPLSAELQEKVPRWGENAHATMQSVGDVHQPVRPAGRAEILHIISASIEFPAAQRPICELLHNRWHGLWSFA